MPIHSISKIIALPFVICIALMLYLGWDTRISVWIIVPVAILVILYTFHGIIDHWWLSKYPLPFDPKLKEWLDKHFVPYQKMDGALRQKFEYRLGLYLNGRLFQSVGKEMRDVPEDIKCMVAAHGVDMSLGLDDYLIGDVDRIFLYKHPFPSPKFQFLHNVETDLEDGVIILSLEQLLNAVLRPDQYYNTAYHAYAEAIIGVCGISGFPDFDDLTWVSIEKITGWTKTSILRQTGFENISLPVLHTTIFFTMPERYQSELPEYYDTLSVLYNRKQ